MESDAWEVEGERQRFFFKGKKKESKREEAGRMIHAERGKKHKTTGLERRSRCVQLPPPPNSGSRERSMQSAFHTVLYLLDCLQALATHTHTHK